MNGFTLSEPARYVRKASIAWAMSTLTLRPIRQIIAASNNIGGFPSGHQERAAVDRQTLLALRRTDGTPMKGSLQIRNQPPRRARADRQDTALVVVA